MATRLTLPESPRPVIDLQPRGWLRDARRARTLRRPDGKAVRTGIYRTITAPFWLASDIPAPHLPARDRKAPPAGPAGDYVVRHLNWIARRVWLQRILAILVRSVWLGLIVACVWLMLDIQGGPEFRESAVGWIVAVCLVPGAIFAALVRPTRRQVARMLDRSFGLQERMVTAVDNLGKGVPAPGERAPLVYLQVADAANVVAEFRGHPAFAIRPPVREVVMVIATGLLLASLYFLRGVGGEIPPTQAGAVPPFKPASERFQEQLTNPSAASATQDLPTLEEIEERAQRSNQAREDLLRLAEALRDHAVTSDAAEAIERGDYDEAADSLRDLAEQADRLSPASREQLARDLDQAASEISEGSQSLSEASRRAADGLREGDEPAKEGVRELGDAVEQTGQDVVSQQELAQQLEQARAAQQSGESGGEPSASQESSNPSSNQQDGQQSAEQEGSSQSQSADGSRAESASSDAGDQSGAQSENQGADGDPASEGQQSASGETTAGEPQEPGQDAGAQAREAGDPGSQGSDGSEQGDAASQGSNAGGQSAAERQEAAAQEGGEQSPDGETSSEGPPSETQAPGRAESTGQGREAEVDPREAITLSRAPDGASVQTSSTGSGANSGAGPGVAISSGNAVQGEVGAAGPDSNRVPPTYRSIVEAYFSESER